MSTLNEYQDAAGKTNKGTTVTVGERAIPGMYNALGMCGEAGEVAEKIKKLARDGVVDDDAVCKELGDVLWYLSQLARDFGFTLQQVADANIAKLESRNKRGVIHGAGDNR